MDRHTSGVAELPHTRSEAAIGRTGRWLRLVKGPQDIQCCSGAGRVVVVMNCYDLHAGSNEVQYARRRGGERRQEE